MALRDWWDLVRFGHGIMWGLCVLIGEFLAQEGIPPVRSMALGFFVPLFAEMGTFALNDYMDMEKDIINRRSDRPLVRGTIKKEHALTVAIATLLAAFILGLLLISKAFIIVVAFLALGILYDVKLKKYTYLKNLILALCVGIPFIGGNIIIKDTIVPMVWFITLVAFVVGFGREIMKDLMDVEGDRISSIKTFPILLGSRNAALIVVILYIATIALTLPPFFLNISEIYHLSPVYGIFICITDMLLLYTCYLLMFKLSVETVNKCRSLTWIGMIAAVIAFILPPLMHFWGG